MVPIIVPEQYSFVSSPLLPLALDWPYLHQQGLSKG
jgi:hypothetical protein